VAENFIILVVIAALAGAFALVLFTAMWRVERRAHWNREAGKRSQRLERRVFLTGVLLVIAMVAVVVTVQLTRRPGCNGTVVVAAAPDGRRLECICELGRRGACFEPGP
jgi:drug/metabolite transporter (DMT)-like permease